jgi:hypothetical protein
VQSGSIFDLFMMAADQQIAIHGEGSDHLSG